ncbi:MAG: hypothetical protein P1U82_26240, partial [Verrucomicrobiales bacterium]|nr:hypothetical protein [Verrucomicrobiales bacterium]
HGSHAHQSRERLLAEILCVSCKWPGEALAIGAVEERAAVAPVGYVRRGCSRSDGEGVSSVSISLAM